MADKRVIEEPSSTELYSDDWFLKDSATNGTRKILASKLKELLCGDYIADEWESLVTYNNGRFVTHEGKLYYNNSGGALVQITFNSNAWLEVKIGELLEKVICSVGEKWRPVDTYHYDDLVVYGGRLYRCIKNASTQGTWVSNEWIEANAEYYFKKVREYIARYGFVPSREAISSPYNKGDLILYRAPGDTTNSLYMRLNDTEYGDPTWIPENWLKVENIGGALSKIYDDMEESSCDIQIKEQSIIDENNVADLTSLAAVGSASGAIASFDDGSDLPMPKLKVAIEPQQEGSGDPSPENIRAISGHTEANVTRTGKNLFGGIDFANAIKDSSSSGEIDYENETVRYSYGTGDKTTIYSDFKPNTAYTFMLKIADCSGLNFSMRLIYTDGTNTPIEVNTSDIGKYITITSNPNKSIGKLSVMWYQTTKVKLKYNECGIFEGALTADDFASYNGQTYTIDLDGTRYGGTLDVVNGVLTVDRVSVTVDENSNIISGSGGLPFRVDLLTGAKASSSASALTGVKCNLLKEVTQSSSWGVDSTFSRVTTDAKIVYFKVNSEITTIQQLKTFLQSNNLQFVYELATPTTYQLTPTQVKSLLGQNNVWCDTGDVLDAEYIRDATTIINSLIARIEALENQ